MPGRGRFWGVGALNDEIVEEADLVPALQGKIAGGKAIEDNGTPLTDRSTMNFTGAGVTVTDDSENAKTVVNIPGGGGGGSNNLEAATVFEEDFYSNSGGVPDNIDYGLMGSGGIQVADNFPIKVGGVADMWHDNSVVGDVWGLEVGGVNNTFDYFDFTSKNLSLKVGLGFNALTNMSAFVGFADDFINEGLNPVSIANLEQNWSEGAYFRWHSTTSGNWIAVTMNGGTKTETDTGVAVTSGNIIKMKIVSNQGTNIIFSINGTPVATHTTNLPATDLGLVISGATITQPNTNGAQATPHGIDYIQIEQDR